jgi:PEP-CTERM motif-containing protein
MQDAQHPSPPRRRRGLIALVILLLVLLPLYLWPIRWGLGGLPGVSAPPGAVGDPRSASALAQIPGDVWDALIGRTHALPTLPPAKPPRNLTMITSAAGIPGGGLEEELSDPAVVARGMLAQLGSSDLSDGSPGGGAAPPGPVEFVSDPGDGAGTGGGPGALSSGGYPGFGHLGPWTSGGPGGGPRVSTLAPPFAPGDPADLAATPEPATLMLVGSNLALLGAAAWRRRRRRLWIPPIG